MSSSFLHCAHDNNCFKSFLLYISLLFLFVWVTPDIAFFVISIHKNSITLRLYFFHCLLAYGCAYFFHSIVLKYIFLYRLLIATYSIYIPIFL